MKILITAYISSQTRIEELEGILSYYKLNVIESNKNFRVFSGNIHMSAFSFFNTIYGQLDEFEFDVEDSVFMAFPSFSDGRHPNLSILVFKRKGNKHLRKPNSQEQPR